MSNKSSMDILRDAIERQIRLRENVESSAALRSIVEGAGGMVGAEALSVKASAAVLNDAIARLPEAAATTTAWDVSISAAFQNQFAAPEPKGASEMALVKNLGLAGASLGEVFKEFRKPDQGLAESFGLLAASIVNYRPTVTLSESMRRLVEASNWNLQALDVNRLGGLAAASVASGGDVGASSVARFFSSYAELYAAPGAALQATSERPPYFDDLVARDLFLKTEILRSIVPQDGVSEVNDELIVEEVDRYANGRLGQLATTRAPEILVMLQGAERAIEGNNPDRGRHVLISLREAMIYLLKTLAPRKEVIAWTQNPEHFLKDRDEPTYRAMVLYSYRKVSNGLLSRHAANMAGLTSDLIRILNRVHAVTVTLDENELYQLLVDTKNQMLSLLEADSL